ncbi:F-box protein [Streptomyces sp. NPDC057910]|uniref:F-box protein n=1 Tax=Streptomyces sp. NPDC057910 TaxID=3346278 RepID=UPI0036E2EB1D
MTTGDVAGAELNGQAQEVWGIVGHAVQDGEPGLPARTYQALQTWPDQHVPDELWTEILTFLPLEDQTRLARTSHHTEGILERLAPQALDPTAHTTTGFIRTIYTQTELNTSLRRWLVFIPGTGSDLTIGQGRARVHGPGTLTAVTAGIVTAYGDITTVTGGGVSAHDETTITTVTGGTVHAHDRATITTVTGGTVHADDQATITTLTGGTVTATGQATITAMTGGDVYADDQVTITTVTGGTVHAHGQASIEEVTGGDVWARNEVTITTVTGGTVYAHDRATITAATGGNVYADDQVTITTVTGGTVHATDQATVTALGGDAHITTYGNARVFIEAGADGVHVDAYDAAHITADSGTVTIHSIGVNVTSNGDAVINHA